MTVRTGLVAGIPATVTMSPFGNVSVRWSTAVVAGFRFPNTRISGCRGNGRSPWSAAALRLVATPPVAREAAIRS